MTSFLRTVTLALLLLPTLALAAMPAGYRFSSILDAIPPEAVEYRAAFSDQRSSLVTATNNNGHLAGFRVGNDGRVYGFNMSFGTNPKMVAVSNNDFVALSIADASCWWIFCNTEFAFGARILPDGTATTAFAHTPLDATIIPGSLPLMRAPGNFVDENRRGVIASTQVDAGGQFGVVLHSAGITTLADVPWLVAINDLAQPLVLAYGGLDGGCLIFGKDCPPAPETATCDDNGGDTHRNTTGRGHVEHGNGNGYGHYKCRIDRNGKETGVIAAEPAPAADPAASNPYAGALLIRVNSDGTTVRYGFPTTALAGGVMQTASRLFPLALGDARAVLRGDVSINGVVHDKRLLACTFDPAALDADGDGRVDCIGGMTLVADQAGGVRVGTVVGFSLNNAGVLAGNFGYNASGIGSPFLLDLAQAQPVPVLVSDLAANDGAWEVHTIADMNQAGKLVGYGFRDCSVLPQAFFIDPRAAATSSALRFRYGDFEKQTVLASGTLLPIAPVVTGGSGSYQYRVQVRTPTDTQWELFSDWSPAINAFDPGNYLGDVCFRIEARDAQNPAVVQSTIVRYAVQAAPSAATSGDSLPMESTGLGMLRIANGDVRLVEALGTAGGLLLAAGLLALRRRRCVRQD